MSVDRRAVLDVCRYFDTWLAFRARRDRVPGIQVAVLHEDEVVLETAHGVADVAAATQLTTAHRFRIASHSKTFTATAVLQLAASGALRLDDTLRRWLPELDDSGIGSVTLRELLAHGGGIVRDGWDGDHWQLARPFPDPSGLRRIAAADAAVLARNERFKYSNIGFALLGAVIEAVTSRSYADHVHDALLAPLGLTATTPDIDPSMADDHATGYTSLSYADERLPLDHVATGALAPATGFSSTASDVVRWAAAHFHGDERILSDDAKRLQQRTEWNVDEGGDYALGFAVGDVGGRRVLGHGGGFPGFITHTWFDPKERIAVSVLTNAIDGPAQSSTSLFLRLLELATSHDRDDEPPVADPTSFTGRYTTLWGSYDIAVLGGRLVALSPALDDPVPAMQRLTVLDADTLRIADSSGYGSPGERYEFRRDPTGAVISVRGSSGSSAVPEPTFQAWLAQRDRIRLGDPTP